MSEDWLRHKALCAAEILTNLCTCSLEAGRPKPIRCSSAFSVNKTDSTVFIYGCTRRINHRGNHVHCTHLPDGLTETLVWSAKDKSYINFDFVP